MPGRWPRPGAVGGSGFGGTTGGTGVAGVPAGAAVQGVPAFADIRVSLPASPLRASLPASPLRVSVPSAPKRPSMSAPPSRVSSPASPERKSRPSPPRRMSLPPPERMSLAAPPQMTSSFGRADEELGAGGVGVADGAAFLNCCGHRDHHRHQGHQHDGRYTHERCALGERVRATGAGERGPCRDGGTRGMMTSRQRSDVLPRPLGAK